METKPQTSKEYFKTLQIIFYALIAGQVLFGLVAFLLHQKIGLDNGLNDLKNIFLYIVPIFIAAGILLSLFTIIFCVTVFIAVERKSHSVSDTFYGIFPYFVSAFTILFWIAGNTSGVKVD